MKRLFFSIVTLATVAFIGASVYGEKPEKKSDENKLFDQTYGNIITDGIIPPPVNKDYGVFFFEQTGNDFRLALKKFLELNKSIEVAPEECYPKENREMRAIPQFVKEKLIGYIIFTRPKDKKLQG